MQVRLLINNLNNIIMANPKLDFFRFKLKHKSSEYKTFRDFMLESGKCKKQDSDFTIYNLPYGIFSTKESAPRVGVAIGDLILDLSVLEEEGLLPTNGYSLFSEGTLNSFIATGNSMWKKTRQRIHLEFGHLELGV